MRPVYVSGIGTTTFGEHGGASAVDLAVQAVEQCLGDAQMPLERVGAIYIGNMLAGLLDGQNHLGALLCERLGTRVPAYRLEAACASGGMAAQAAFHAVGGGAHDTVLVVGTEAMTHAGVAQVNKALKNAASDAERLSGIGFASLYGLMARAYLSQYDLPESALWWGPALAHRLACDNPAAQYHKAFTPEQVGRSRVIASPLRLLECSPHTDGAAAVLLQSTPTDIQITASTMATDTPGLAERDTITSVPAAARAWAQIKADTGLSAADLDVVELHDCFSIAGVMAAEDLDLAPRGQGGTLYQNLYEATDAPRCAINPSGGLKASGHPVGATGVKQIASVVQHLRTHPHATKGLTHNIGGTGGTAVLHLFEQL